MEIRRVLQTDDVTAISRIYALSWKEAYKDIVPAQFLDELHENSWTDIFQNSSYEHFVMIKNGNYIGTSSICASFSAFHSA